MRKRATPGVREWGYGRQRITLKQGTFKQGNAGGSRPQRSSGKVPVGARGKEGEVRPQWSIGVIWCGIVQRPFRPFRWKARISTQERWLSQRRKVFGQWHGMRCNMAGDQIGKTIWIIRMRLVAGAVKDF